MTEDKNISKKIPAPMRHFLKVYTSSNCDPATTEAFIAAVKILNKKIRMDRVYHAFIGHSPFSLPATGEFSYKMGATNIGIVIEHFIFIDFVLLVPYPHYLKVAVILEELVHALLNVTNHPLAPQIVSLFYPSVVWNDTLQVYETSGRDNKKAP